MHLETLERAPAAVSIITDEQIRRYGYRSIGDVLDNEIGFLTTGDHAYRYVGVRGFGLPSDYGSRLLIMVNGHVLAEPIYGTAAFFGEEFGVDVEIIKRIEVIRGPSSALYGSNGVFATVNIVTKSAEELPRLSGTVSTGSGGQRLLQAASTFTFGKSGSAIISAKGYTAGGDSLYLADYAGVNGDGVLRNHDGESAYHAFFDVRWKNWDITGLLATRRKDLPIGWAYEPFSRNIDRDWDRPNYIDATYTRDVGAHSNLTWRSYYDWYSYLNRGLDKESGTALREDMCRSDRVGTRMAYRTEYERFGAVTAGIEANIDPRVLQRNLTLYPDSFVYLNSNEPNVSTGAFLQWERDLGGRWKAVAGVRHDWNRAGRQFVSPRLALIWNASARTTYKFLYGRAFRNPDGSELYYAEPGYQAPIIGLRPESADTLEFDAERRLSHVVSASVNSYVYEIRGLIEAVKTDKELLQYRNAGKDRAAGLEWKISARWSKESELVAGGSLQHASTRSGDPVPNSPRMMWKVRGSVPVVPRRLVASSAFRWVNGRQTLSGGVLPAYGNWDAAFTTTGLHPNFDLQFGIANILDRRHLDPAAMYLDAVPSNGRQWFVRLFWKVRD